VRESAARRTLAAARRLQAQQAAASVPSARDIARSADDDSADPLLRLLELPRPLAHPLGVRPRWQRRYSMFLLTADVFAAVGGLLLAVLIDLDKTVGPAWWMTFVWPALVVLANGTTRSYEPRFWGAGNEEFRRVFDAGVRLLAVGGLITLAWHLHGLRTFIILGIPLTVALGLGGRYGLRQLLLALRRRNVAQHRVILVGRERSVAEFTARVRSEPACGLRIVGACVDNARGTTVGDVPVVGDSTTIQDAVDATGADTVAVTSFNELSQEDVRKLSWELEHTRATLMVAPRLTDVSGPRLTVRPVAGVPMLNIEPPEFRGARRVIKGAFDRVAAAILVFLLLPALITIALAIRLTSRGPALFRQERIGRHGRNFTMFKFRTMVVDAEERLNELVALNEGSGLLFKIRRDPRVTSVGRWLRRLSLDELPQLFNVLTGDMSLVGPRPPLASEVSGYEDEVYRRLLVKPGLTGLWQVSGRSDIAWAEAVRLDLFYVENWSLTLDLAILWRTLNAVVRARGAY